MLPILARKCILLRRGSAEEPSHEIHEKKERKTKQIPFRDRAGRALQNGRGWSGGGVWPGPHDQYGQQRRCFCHRTATHTRWVCGTVDKLASAAESDLPHAPHRLWASLAIHRVPR